MKENYDNKDVRLEVVELRQKVEDLEDEVKKLEQIISEKEAVISDSNVYIESITEQLNEKTDEVLKQNERLHEMNERVQNNSTINTKDEEIASLQAEIALLHDIKNRERALEDQVETLKIDNKNLEEHEKKQSDKIEQIEADLVAEHEQFLALSQDMVQYNAKVTNLKSELVKRNEEIVEFVKIMKNIKQDLHSRGSPLSAYIYVDEESNEQLSWDHGYENFLTPAKVFIEKLVDDNLEKSKQFEADKSAHLRQLDERILELEAVLSEKEALIEEFYNTDKDFNEVKIRLEETENEQVEMQSYVNAKLAEIKKLRHDLHTAEEINMVNEDKLSKAMSAIQGFVTENLKMSQDLAEQEAKMTTLSQEQSKQMDVLCLENERMKTELEQAAEGNFQFSGRAFYMQRGIDKAKEEFASSLGDYRLKFDSVLEAWRSSKENCDLMRGRLEELTDFLQTIIDNEREVGDLNISSLSVDMRDMLQRSVDESRLLSASILENQQSVLLEMSALGLDMAEDDIYHLGEETWLVPDVDVSIFDDEQDDESVPKKEYDSLLLELRDNLTKRRVAEEELEMIKSQFEGLSVQTHSKIPIADGNVKTRARSGSRRRKTLTKIPGPSGPGLSEEDDWSEPDKAESRRRIGLEEVEEKEAGTRSTEGERSAANNAEDGAELRRERGRVERMRQELSASTKREGDNASQLQAARNSLEKCKRDLQKQRDIVEKIELRMEVVDGENEQQRKTLRQRESAITDLEARLAEVTSLVEKLNNGIEYWKVECKKLGEGKRFSVDVSTMDQELEIGSDMKSKTQELGKKIKKLVVENEKLLTVSQKDVKDYEALRIKYQQKKSELNKLKGTNLLLEERCLELENIVNSHDAKIGHVEVEMQELKETKRRQSMMIKKKDENMSQAETLLKELNDSNKNLKQDLKQVTAQFDKYKQDYSDEVIQNIKNEIETKAKSQSDATKKMADELRALREGIKSVESKLQTKTDLLKTAEKEIRLHKDATGIEKSKTEELGKTIENMRKNIEILSTEKMRKESLEEEFTHIQKQLSAERDIKKKLEQKMDKLEKSKKLTEERCLSAEKVLKALSTDSFNENKENSVLSSSKQEVETALLHSRPSSRRQGLAPLDSNSRNSLPIILTEPASASDLKSQLEAVTLERDAALAKLKTTRSSLASAAGKLSEQNRRKKEMERNIVQQLNKTHNVLKKTKTNLENVTGQNK